MRKFEKISFEQFKKDVRDDRNLKMIKNYMKVIYCLQEVLKEVLDMILEV